MTGKRVFTCLAAAVLLSVAGCAAPPALDDRDAAALERLGQVAGPTSGVDADAITGTECWLPSEHRLKDGVDSETMWRVMCRVHYTDDSGERYKDTTCIGDFSAEPMLDHCYRWTHYDFAEAFEDHAGTTTG